MEWTETLRRKISALDSEIREAGKEESNPNNPQAAEYGEYRGKLESERSELTRKLLAEEYKFSDGQDLFVKKIVKYVVNGVRPRLEVLYNFHAGTQIKMTCDLSKLTSETEVGFELDDFPSSPFFQYEVISFGTGW